MPAALEKIRKDIMANRPGMSKDMAYALATNIWKKRKKAGVYSNKGKVSKSRAYKAFEKSEPKDVESKESFAEKAREYKRGK